MRILHVIPSVAPCRGGASKAVLDMVKALRQQNLDVEIACTNDDGANLLQVPLGKLIEYQGVPVRFFAKYSPGLKALREFTYSGDFKAWLKQHIGDYDIVHVHALFSFCSTYTMRLARRRGINYIAHPIGHLEAWSLVQGRIKKYLYLHLFEKANLRNARLVHCTADSESQQAKALIPELKTVVIPLGLDVPPLRQDAKLELCKKWQVSSQAPIIVFLARIHPKKGLELLFAALAALGSQPFSLLLAGEGEAGYVAELQKRLQRLDLHRNCHFIGYIEGADKDLLLQGADLFALTSYSENFGIAVLEAMANATAVLVTDGVALSRQVGDHQLGFVTRPTVEAVAAALKVALSAPQMMSDMGHQARRFVELHFQWQQAAAQLAENYREVLDKNASSLVAERP